MILQGKTLWISLGAALLVGVGGGTFLSGWRKARGLDVQTSADAGVRVNADAGVAAACECVTDVQWKTITVPVPGPTRYIRGDAGIIEIHTVQTMPILVPDLHLSGHTEANAESASGGQAEAGASAHVAIPEPGVSLVWGVGGGVQHDDAYRPTVGASLGLEWGAGGIRIAGAVDPLSTQHWNALVLYGGKF